MASCDKCDELVKIIRIIMEDSSINWEYIHDTVDEHESEKSEGK